MTGFGSARGLDPAPVVVAPTRRGEVCNDGERTGTVVHIEDGTAWVVWDGGGESLVSLPRLVSGSIPSIPVPVPVLERLLADADASPATSTSSDERDEIGRLIDRARGAAS